MRKNLNIMMKPSSSKCNIDCEYCFYKSISETRSVKDCGFMSKEILFDIVNKADEYCNGGFCNIGFQGGEPLMIGLDFYKDFIAYIERKNFTTSFNFSIQTNGILINESWARFFKKNDFLVGISLDGNEKIHNFYRKDKQGECTFHKVINAIDILEKYKVEFNVLTVVTSKFYKNINDCYEFYKYKGLKYLQFIPCIKPPECQLHKSNRYLTSEQYGDFLCKLFNLWYEDAIRGDYVSIRYFDNILAFLLGYEYESCDMRGICSCQNIIESDGSVYPCDFYTYDQYRIGNVIHEGFNNLKNKDQVKNFILTSQNKRCKYCKYEMLCRGGCRRQRESFQDMESFCRAHYKFFQYSLEKFIDLARRKNIR